MLNSSLEQSVYRGPSVGHPGRGCVPNTQGVIYKFTPDGTPEAFLGGGANLPSSKWGRR